MARQPHDGRSHPLLRRAADAGIRCIVIDIRHGLPINATTVTLVGLPE
jgi:hypothetical protein